MENFVARGSYRSVFQSQPWSLECMENALALCEEISGPNLILIISAVIGRSPMILAFVSLNLLQLH